MTFTNTLNKQSLASSALPNFIGFQKIEFRVQLPEKNYFPFPVGVFFPLIWYNKVIHGTSLMAQTFGPFQCSRSYWCDNDAVVIPFLLVNKIGSMCQLEMPFDCFTIFIRCQSACRSSVFQLAYNIIIFNPIINQAVIKYMEKITNVKSTA